MRIVPLSIILVLLIGCGGGGGGTAPTISDLTLTSSSVVRGSSANGSVTVTDPDGLKNLKLIIKISGPATTSTETPVQGATSSILEAVVPFSFILTGAAPTGNYTLTVTAKDGEGNKSNDLSMQFEVK